MERGATYTCLHVFVSVPRYLRTTLCLCDTSGRCIELFPPCFHCLCERACVCQRRGCPYIVCALLVHTCVCVCVCVCVYVCVSQIASSHLAPPTQRNAGPVPVLPFTLIQVRQTHKCTALYSPAGMAQTTIPSTCVHVCMCVCVCVCLLHAGSARYG